MPILLGRIYGVLGMATLVVASFVASSTLAANDNGPKPVPATRVDLKIALEKLKERTPRLPLPATADGEPSVNNGRMRATYLPASWQGGNAGRRVPGQRGNNGAATLDYELTTSCFWIASRGNNCHYCLGHQELKLAGAGVSDDKIAALDYRWDDFDPRTRAALKFTRQMTLEPHLIDDADIADLKTHFNDAEIIELAFIVGRFNATNRWTDGTGIPQDNRFDDSGSTLISPTSTQWADATSTAAPTTRKERPALPTAKEIEASIAKCRDCEPRVALPAVERAQEVLAEAFTGRAPLNWERALAALPTVGPAYVTSWNLIRSDDHLSPRLKNELAYITAIHNRAWYAAATAATELEKLGVTAEQRHGLLTAESDKSPSAAAYRLARKSTVDSHLIVDADIEAVRAHFSDAETAQILHVICTANWFDRFTAALGLPLDSPTAG
jgi:alkylhydroperoxidase family enzyme